MLYKESKPFYHTKAWQRARGLALARDRGMCCRCMERFERGLMQRPRRATVVHHLETVEARPDLALALDNLQSLCAVCHNQAHPEKGCGGGKQQQSPARGMRVIKI